MEAIAGPFQIDWSKEDLERVTRSSIKKYNAEFHSQSALEGALELKQANGFTGQEVDRVEIEIFDVAYNIIGGGEEGEKTTIHTKEEADHSLPYMVAVAILDGMVTPKQYEPDRIRRQDVQELLRRVTVRPSPELSRPFPDEMPCKITVWLKGGQTVTIEKRDYEGFWTRPMPWDQVVQKFDGLAAPYADAGLRQQIVDAVGRLEQVPVADLMQLLASVQIPARTMSKRAA